MEKLKAVSLFCGCGGTDVGMLGGFTFLNKKYSRNPINLVYANDFEQSAADIFNKNFKMECHVDDIRKVSAVSIPDHDILTGGFPCQSFSIVAQNPPRLGCKDEKGKLFFEMCRILKAKKPKAFIAENVKGILSVNKGEVFPLIISEFEKCGYIVSWFLLNSANYGVPQRRERVFIVGFQKSLGLKFCPPRPTRSIAGNLFTEKWVPLKEVVFPHSEVDNKYFFSDRAHEGLKRSNKAMNKGRAQNIETVCNTVGAHLAKVSLNSTDPVLKVNGRYRRFTPREVARIQSFPDNFKLAGSDSAQYRALGNAIPPVLMWHVTKQVINILKNGNQEDIRTDKEKRSYNMAHIRSKNTSIEEILNDELKKMRWVFQRNVKDLPGKPDFVYKRKKAVIFCDSEFWHGKDYPECVNRIRTNREFWNEKIERNVERDKKVNRELKKNGWRVLRLWDSDIKHNNGKTIAKIKKFITQT